VTFTGQRPSAGLRGSGSATITDGPPPAHNPGVNIDLREGLVEVPGVLPTFASPGVGERAVAIGRIAADSYDYLCALLGFRPEAQVLVVTEADWARVSGAPLYGLPNAIATRPPESAATNIAARLAISLCAWVRIAVRLACSAVRICRSRAGSLGCLWSAIPGW
jgi:hypothetical protein